MIDILVVFENTDYLRTRINCTLEEAKEYYKGNYFTSTNEQQVKAVNVFLYDEWKEKVLNNCMKNNNTVLNFNDDQQTLYFKTPYNDYVTVTYQDVNNHIEAPTGWTFGDLYGYGWENPLYDTKEEAIKAAKEKFKSSDGRFVEVGWSILLNNQLNVVKCERINF